MRISCRLPCRLAFWSSGFHKRPSHRNKPYLHSPVQSRCNSLQHRKRVTVVIRIFETANYRGRGPHPSRQFPLAQPCLRPQVVKQLSHFDIDDFLFVGSYSLRVTPDERVIGVLKCRRMKVLLHRHTNPTSSPWPERVPFRVYLKCSLPCDGPVNLRIRHSSLFHKSMRYDHGLRPLH